MNTTQLPHMIEYRQCTPDMRSIDTVIRQEDRVNDYNRTIQWTLSHRTPGYVCAGSAMRLQEREIWRVTTFMDNATHGQGFLTLAKAEEWLSQRGTLAR